MTNKLSNFVFKRTPLPELREKYRGCLIGGAIGDALGAPVEFLSLEQIKNRYGFRGVGDYQEAFDRLGSVTDDTQMTLFTAEGVLRAFMRMRTKGICDAQGVIRNAYLRWLHTQGEDLAITDSIFTGWLYKQKDLFHRRAPGNTCLASLKAIATDMSNYPINDSKGCGCVMRVAPIGLLYASIDIKDGHDMSDQVFIMGIGSAEITHSHPTGKLTSGFFSLLIYYLALDKNLMEAIDLSIEKLKTYEAHQETLESINHAITLAKSDLHHEQAIAALGEGWVAEEALAIALYSAVKAKDFTDGITMAVNHSGDSDSTGLMAGQLLGLISGWSNLPTKFIDSLEVRSLIEEISDDLVTAPDWPIADGVVSEEFEYYWNKYPGN